MHESAIGPIALTRENIMKPLIRTMLLLIGMFVIAGATFASAQTPSPPGAKVYFINLKDGAELDSPFLVQFGLSGMGIAPGGEDVRKVSCARRYRRRHKRCFFKIAARQTGHPGVTRP